MPSDASVQRLRKLNATVDLDKLEKEGKALLPQLLKYSQDMEDMQVPPQLQVKNLLFLITLGLTLLKCWVEAKHLGLWIIKDIKDLLQQDNLIYKPIIIDLRFLHPISIKISRKIPDECATFVFLPKT